ncbi:MAG: hypothetical protein AB9869_02240 [Verrucomicrobiia bacterium]
MAIDRTEYQFCEQDLESEKRRREAIYRGDERCANMEAVPADAIRDAIRANPGTFNFDASAARLATTAGVKILREILAELKPEADAKVAAAQARVDAARARYQAEAELAREEAQALSASLAIDPAVERAENAKRHQARQEKIAKRASELAAK